ncbi:MAG: spore protease YyaC [Clostridium sp.]|nr:spore protease YyaC [Clostridium sp.]
MSSFRKLFSSGGKNTSRVASSDPFAVRKIKETLQRLMRESYQIDEDQLVVLCIGTDRSTGDALGPLIGSKLSRLQPNKVFVYGTLDEPVHAVNLPATIEKLERDFSRPYIIAVDACLGRPESVGAIDIGTGSLRPGAGVNKDLPSVGNIYISGIVNVGGFLEYFVLQNTRLSLVMHLAETITSSLYFSIEESRPDTIKGRLTTAGTVLVD